MEGKQRDEWTERNRKEIKEWGEKKRRAGESPPPSQESC